MHGLDGQGIGITKRAIDPCIVMIKYLRIAVPGFQVEMRVVLDVSDRIILPECKEDLGRFRIASCQSVLSYAVKQSREYAV